MSEITWLVPSAVPVELGTTPDVAEGQTDHVAKAIGRLPEQFKQPNNQLLLTALVAPANDLEAALWQLLTERSISTAIGAQLDRLGRIVGQARDGKTDDDYRRYIRARILTNRSEGTIDDLIRVGRLVLGSPNAKFKVQAYYPKSVRVELLEAVADPALTAALISFLRDTVAGGTYCTLITNQFDLSEMFTTRFCVYAAGITAGDTTLTLVGDESLLYIPTSGFLTINFGGATPQRVGYSIDYTAPVVDGLPTIKLTSAVTLTWPDPTILVVVDELGTELSTGKGFGDTGNPATGGHLADASI